MAHVLKDKFDTAIQDFGFSVAARMFPNVIPVHKFFAGTVSTSRTTVCDVRSDSVYHWVNPSSYGAITLSSTSPADSIAGAGCRQMHVWGVTNSYDLRDEVVAMNGSNPVTTANSDYIHVWRAHGDLRNGITNINSIQEAGSIGMTIAGVQVARVQQARGQTLMSPFIVPRGYTAYIYFGKISSPSGKALSGAFYYRETAVDSAGGQSHSPLRTAHEFSAVAGGYDYPFSVPVPIPQYSRVQVDAQLDVGNARVTGGYDLVLFPNVWDPSA